eukprot:CAMPEP_0204829500 /NCGR_PEP_ID=MMETSP1346-20131115/7705_1 /ASSEMBLY_ACC=CAM_ASM_000771 /TAXON_ID=215587 /ORGANISM="Aplanochytrium stocchinoi, Strain GSBS06" /LENGTH=271 /DNA_ID=CAMNT_0051959353 /DNA_START=149 /DNA_END=964 /DNA_ORIENTATION=-
MKRSVSQSDVDEKKNVDKDTSTEPKSQKQKVDEKETNIAEESSEEEGELLEEDNTLLIDALSNKWKEDLKKPPPRNIVESPLQHACAGSKIQGLWLEFGVFSGKTINLMAQYAPEGVVVSGFDTFEGLPESWRDKFDKGAFDRGGKFPKVASNVRLVKGLFQDTLEGWIKQNVKDDDKVSICHLDADLYSATIFVLRTLSKYIVPGTILVFDELINFPGYEEHEWKALLESVLEFGWSFEWIGQSAVLEDPPVIDVWKTQQVGLRITGANK